MKRKEILGTLEVTLMTDDGGSVGRWGCWHEGTQKDVMDSGGRDFLGTASGRWQWRG